MTFQPNGGHLYAYNLNSAGTFEALAQPIPAPGPLPLLGLGAAFGFSHRLRKRTVLSSSAASVQNG